MWIRIYGCLHPYTQNFSVVIHMIFLSNSAYNIFISIFIDLFIKYFIRFNESCSNISVSFWLVTNKCFFSLRCYACWLIMLAYVNAFARLHLIDVIINQPKYVGMHFFTPCSPRIHMHLIYLERYPYVRREAFTIN